jgi:hypothetical protein
MLSILNYRFSCPPDVTQKIKAAEQNGQLEAFVSSLPEGTCVEIREPLFGYQVLNNLVELFGYQAPSSLHVAIRDGNYKAAYLFIRLGADLNAASWWYGETALHMAVNAGREDLVKLLLDSGARINIQDQNGWTPLQCATYNHITSIVVELLKRGADATIKTKSGHTALSLIKGRRRRDLYSVTAFVCGIYPVAILMNFFVDLLRRDETLDEILAMYLYTFMTKLVILAIFSGAIYVVVVHHEDRDRFLEEFIERHIKDQLTAPELYIAKDGLSSPALVDYCQEIQCKNTPPQPLSTADKITIVVNTSSACIVVPQSSHRDFLNCAIETGVLPASGNLWHEVSSAYSNASLLDNHSGQMIVEVVGALLLCLPAAA